MEQTNKTNAVSIQDAFRLIEQGCQPQMAGRIDRRGWAQLDEALRIVERGLVRLVALEVSQANAEAAERERGQIDDGLSRLEAELERQAQAERDRVKAVVEKTKESDGKARMTVL